MSNVIVHVPPVLVLVLELLSCIASIGTYLDTKISSIMIGYISKVSYTVHRKCRVLAYTTDTKYYCLLLRCSLMLDRLCDYH